MEDQGLATGSADGKVQLWTSSLEMAVCIDIKSLGPIRHMVHSLSWDVINHKVRYHRRALFCLASLLRWTTLDEISKIGENTWFARGHWLAQAPIAALSREISFVRIVSYCNQMLVATDSCEIYELLDSDGTNLHRGPLVQGHFGHGVRGLAVHPTNPDQFASAGADRTVRIWTRADRKMASSPEDLQLAIPV